VLVCLDGLYDQRLVPRLPVFIQRQLDMFSHETLSQPARTEYVMGLHSHDAASQRRYLVKIPPSADSGRW
jgi:hypothetical protein